MAGVPTVFVRVGGCDYRCSWCDSLYAVLPEYKGEWRRLTAEEILTEIGDLTDQKPCVVTLSGGNPALYDLASLIGIGHSLRYTFAIETQGTKLPEWAYHLDFVTVSPKPPSSGMKTDWAQLAKWCDVGKYVFATSLKVVVFDDADYTYARQVYDMRSQGAQPLPMYLQAGTDGPYRNTDSFETMAMFRDDILRKTAWLGQKVIDDKWYDVRVLPQVHALINGAKRGV